MLQLLLKAFHSATGVCTDTRLLKAGDLFFALKGPNFDGNRFAERALEMGASAVVVDDTALAGKRGMILVEDTLLALQRLANAYRKSLTIPVVALTGSNGKTTTKELLASALATEYRVSYTQGNLNNHIGVPLTLLRIPSNAEIAVVEMGANRVGDIEELCQIAEPSHGIITNIGRAHLEGFGGIEGVRIGKGQMFDWLAAKSGCAFVDVANDEVERLAQRVPYRLEFSSDARAEPSGERELMLIAEIGQAYPHVTATLYAEGKAQQIESVLPGEHNYSNLVCAAAVAHYFKVSLPNIAAAFADYRPDNHRSEERKYREGVILVDSYNANPDSTAAGLNWLASRKESRKIAILGSLAELGAFAKTAHQEVLAKAEQIPGIEIALFGSGYEHIGDEHPKFSTHEELSTWLSQRMGEPDTVVLIKGSRSNRLEKLLPEG